MCRNIHISSSRMKTYICMLVVFIECFVVGNSQEMLYEGDACITRTNEAGVCVRLSLCTSAQEMLKKNVPPINCGFIKSMPIVCCLKNELKYTYLAEKKCEIYNEPIYSIVVVMGEDAKLKEFPSMAALGYNKNNKKVWLCGGTLTSDKFVLTAAHCLASLEFGAVKWVRLGVVDINQPVNDENFNDQSFEVIRTIAHPLYKPPSVYHDIALIELDKPARFTSFVKPACFYMQDDIPEETKLFAAGWGLTTVSGNQSSILQKVTLDLFSEEECNLNYNNAGQKRKLKHGILHQQQICAGGKKIGTDTCQGDSGGPLLIKKQIEYIDVFYVVGVTSFGKSCGIVNVPGIYTRVSRYVPWIESVIWSNEN